MHAARGAAHTYRTLRSLHRIFIASTLHLRIVMTDGASRRPGIGEG
jgi:hypothetical protein